MEITLYLWMDLRIQRPLAVLGGFRRTCKSHGNLGDAPLVSSWIPLQAIGSDISHILSLAGRLVFFIPS